MVGGTLYVHDLAGPWEWSQIVDLGDAAIASPAMRAAGERVVPRHKPHMVLPSPDQAYVAVTYTGDKFVHILDASTKEVVVSLDARRPAAGVVGGAMHAGAWHGNEHFIIVDMTGSVNDVAGGALHKYQVDVANGVSYHKASLAIGLSASDRGTTATKPIAMGGNAIGAYADLYFVTDAKGAGSIINGTSMTVVRNLPLADFGACTGGGLWIVPHPEISEVVIAQYGTVGGTQCLYQVNLKSLTITKTYALPTAADDAHGIAFCRASTGGHFLVNTNRASATLDVLDYETGRVALRRGCRLCLHDAFHRPPPQAPSYHATPIARLFPPECLRTPQSSPLPKTPTPQGGRRRLFRPQRPILLEGAPAGRDLFAPGRRV